MSVIRTQTHKFSLTPELCSVSFSNEGLCTLAGLRCGLGSYRPEKESGDKSENYTVIETTELSPTNLV